MLPHVIGKLSPTTLFQDRFHFIETDDLALHTIPESLNCAQDKHLVFSECVSKHKLVYIISSDLMHFHCSSVPNELQLLSVHCCSKPALVMETQSQPRRIV